MGYNKHLASLQARLIYKKLLLIMEKQRDKDMSITREDLEDLAGSFDFFLDIIKLFDDPDKDLSVIDIGNPTN